MSHHAVQPSPTRGTPLSGRAGVAAYFISGALQPILAPQRIRCYPVGGILLSVDDDDVTTSTLPPLK